MKHSFSRAHTDIVSFSLAFCGLHTDILEHLPHKEGAAALFYAVWNHNAEQI